MGRHRQQVLHLWLGAAALDTTVSGWAFYDGTDGNGPRLPEGTPPYVTGVDALRDGWMLLQAPGPLAADRVLAETGSEFVFTRTVDTEQLGTEQLDTEQLDTE